MNNALDALMDRHADKVRAVANILVESPYFYKTDNENLFYFLRRHQREFAGFFEKFFEWTLYVDTKCARVYKDRWYNEAVNPSQRELFNFTRRDECIAFMLLLEFFEQQIDIQGVTVDERENLRFRYGDLLEHVHQRIHELFEDERKKAHFTEEYVRARVLGAIMPRLEKYRFLLKIAPPKDGEVHRLDTIYEALPALYHYNAVRLSKGIFEHYDEEPIEIPAAEEDDSDGEAEPAAVDKGEMLPGAGEDA
ncbi:MAG: DUF2398 family protein [Acidobacteriota bacterium]|nr:DUF2398 family protein [Acidobacteriota bacterium]